MGDILFMGPPSSGKTMLLRRLQSLSSDKHLSPFDTPPSTHPTEGIDSSTFKFRGLSCIFKELGGNLVSQFKSHCQGPRGIVYVFDGADLTKMATNIVYLNDLLREESLQQKPILIVISKCDVPDCVRFSIIDEIIGLNRVVNPSRLSFAETSSLVGAGLTEVFHWASDVLK